MGLPQIVIMGHEACGAVEAALSVVEQNAKFPGAIGNMIEPIIPAVLEARGKAGNKVENAIKANVSRTVRMLRSESDPLMMKPREAGKLKVVGAYYELKTGRVDYFDKA
jgi:carbonic anhydrase